MTLVKLVKRLAGRTTARTQGLVDVAVQDLIAATNAPFFSHLQGQACLADLLGKTAVPTLARIEDRAGVLWVVVAGRRVPVRWHARIPAGSERQALYVHHHGAGEIPSDASLRAAEAGTPVVPQVVVEGPGHRTPRSFGRWFHDGDAALAGMVASVAALEALRRAWNGPVLLGGVSFGGMIATCHARRWGQRTLAEQPRSGWMPVVAGPDFAHVLQRSAYARLLDRRWRAPGAASVVDCARWPLAPTVAARCWPLLGLWDHVHLASAQVPAWQALGVQPRVVRFGHIGVCMDGRALGAHLARCRALVAASSRDIRPLDRPGDMLTEPSDKRDNRLSG